MTDLPRVGEWFRWSEQAWEQAHQQLEHMAQVTKEFADCCRGEIPHYEPGDLGLVIHQGHQHHGGL